MIGRCPTLHPAVVDQRNPSDLGGLEPSLGGFGVSVDRVIAYGPYLIGVTLTL
jgi:hypothetical protein